MLEKILWCLHFNYIFCQVRFVVRFKQFGCTRGTKTNWVYCILCIIMKTKQEHSCRGAIWLKHPVLMWTEQRMYSRWTKALTETALWDLRLLLNVIYHKCKCIRCAKSFFHHGNILLWGSLPDPNNTTYLFDCWLPNRVECTFNLHFAPLKMTEEEKTTWSLI